jgi:phage host-nuclease inhibitor protein Gam
VTDPEIVVRTDDENASMDDMDLEIVDGCLMTPDGEVVGTAEFEAIDEIVDEETADAMLARIAAVQGQLVALRLRREAILANLEAMERPHRRRLEYLVGRFTPLLEAYAARRLKLSKRRSFDVAHGRIGFRKAPGSAKITDMGKALAFLREVGRDELIERTVVEKVKAAELAAVVDDWEGKDVFAPSELDFLDRTPPGDRFRIQTGILDG